MMPEKMTPERLAAIRSESVVVRELLNYITELEAELSLATWANTQHEQAQRGASNPRVDCAFCGCAMDAFGNGHHSAECVDTDGGKKPNPFQAQRGAVVVPEPDGGDIGNMCDAIERESKREWTGLELSSAISGMTAGVEWARKKARAISANRVLGEGQVAVDREELDAIRVILAQARECAAHPHRCDFSDCHNEALKSFDALRTQAGEVKDV